ncbi:4-(cytidine 5'-diphospho)-2-C-methyl-D-erythritol kinase [Helicobacter fennelliae]|uniref:4-diphosphocytidyl-2-C-methyl-D-erythritol kinase n=2 Tax=Helicobacter fennelliae TaxID=215 RepID=T1DV17_9HELI|nr:4-(cytidine 5'-diphospho)-2-C-methyl-D-erythritol kinase [Helicobacter fennelliae]GAD18152.1 4-diphosphocytidyl-2-C-methyl-D-erythritol kinase [Helicobacter fennelliae MRY12-0050]SQB98047.1 4-diphosphocytidyl-2-C-methyl-D-erythritol kinase [Helicobacter fennelliae]STP06742.1 4-diphosphocytidyl-2-C-methyl-D-erythritol kinase [Helicobacter fennelliae]STQ83701.1 4-diphosphocytidyl-2-C-methyl-D-erythritol kinase [Helicobacter fennelliae]
MTLKAYPKINLYLKLVGIQHNNHHSYHLLESRFGLITSGVYDEIFISESSHDSIKGDFGCDWQKSSVFQALVALRKFYPIPPLRIEVQKRIPIGAGLGGGSSDAGVLLSALNQKFSINLNQAKLAQIAKSIGADVAFFTQGHRFAEVRGIGEIIEPKQILDSDMTDFEIFTPPIFCDTKQVYQCYIQMRQNKQIQFSAKNLFANLDNQTLFTHNCADLNDLFLPASTLYPQLLNIKKDLGDEWFFSGSGSSFFRPVRPINKSAKPTSFTESIDSTNTAQKRI